MRFVDRGIFITGLNGCSSFSSNYHHRYCHFAFGYYNITVHYALWVDWVRQEKYQQAYQETLNFRRPMFFWDPRLKAATLGQLGRIKEGRQATENLLKRKPDFPTRGMVLIEHYIKFEDIVERIIDGLSKVGLKIE